MKYLTPNQYTLADDGISLTGLASTTLARMITRAESDIDAFIGFDMKRGGFEPHNVWLQSRFDEKSLKTPLPNYPVPIRQVTRYRIQVSNISTAGAGFFANINAGDCVINEDGGYVEIVPLQAVTYSLSPIILQLGLRPPIVQMDCEVGHYLPVFGETLVATDTTYTTYVASHGFWASSYTQALAVQPNQLPPIPAVIYVNGAAQSTGYTINATEGTVTFSSSQQSNTVSADYTYTIPDAVQSACVDQVTYLLGQRKLNQRGMQGVGMIHQGKLEIRTLEAFPARFPTDNGSLCDHAARRLVNFKPIAIA
jgi:hypothetical protein